MTKDQNDVRKETLRNKVNKVATKVAVVSTPFLFVVSAHAEDAIDVGTLGLTGLATAAATVFAIKASPSLMMWGYRKVLGFIGR